MGLTIRMALYLVFGVVAGQGVGVFDPEAGTFTVEIESLAAVLSGLAGFVGTFWTSRIAKKNGGMT